MCDRFHDFLEKIKNQQIRRDIDLTEFTMCDLHMKVKVIYGALKWTLEYLINSGIQLLVHKQRCHISHSCWLKHLGKVMFGKGPNSKSSSQVDFF